MLTNLQTLHDLIKTLGDKLESTRRERDALTARLSETVPKSDWRDLQVQKAELENKLGSSAEQVQSFEARLKNGSARLAELEAELRELKQTNEKLLQDKQELEAKNRISLERAKSILERLSAIDKGQLS